MTTALTWRDLAAVVSLAVRASPAHLRRARREVLRPLDAGAEGDVWWSGLVQARSPLGVVFHPRERARLHDELRVSGRLEAAWKVVSSFHAETPAPIVEEERLTWLALRGGGETEIGEGLGRILRSLCAAPPPVDLARWMLQAWRRLPAAVRARPEAVAAAIVAGQVLKLPVLDGDPTAEVLAFPWEGLVRGETASVRVRREGSTLRLDLAEEGATIEVPRTRPVLVGVRVGAESRVRVVPEGEGIAVEVGEEDVELGGLDGRRWAVRDAGAGGGAARTRREVESPFVTAGALPPGSPLFVGREEELEQILAGVEKGVSTWIQGERGVGKTSLLWKVRHRLARSPAYELYWFEGQGCRRLEELRGRALLPEPGDPETVRLEDLVNRAAPAVALINEPDGLLAEDRGFEELLLRITDPRSEVVAIATGRQAPARFDLAYRLQVVRLGGLPTEAALHLLDLLEDHLRLRWPDSETREEARTAIVRATRGQPRAIQRLCQALAEDAAKRRTDVIGDWRRFLASLEHERTSREDEDEWRRIYEAFDPSAPVTDPNLRAHRAESPSAAVLRGLKIGTRCFLVGPRGSGKSTELHHAAQSLARQRPVVLLDLTNTLDPTRPLEPWEILVYVGLALGRVLWQAEGWGPETLPSLDTIVCDMYAGGPFWTGSGAETATAMAAALDVWASSGTARGSLVRLSHEGRPDWRPQRTMQTLEEGRINVLRGSVEKLVRLLGDDLLLCLDGLPVNEHAFADTWYELTQLPCALLIARTGGPPMSYDRIPNVWVPAICPFDRHDPTRPASDLRFFHEIWERRAGERHDLLDPAHVDRLAWASGGCPRSFCALVRDVAASSAESVEEAIEHAVRDLRLELARSATPDALALLRRVAEDSAHALPDDPLAREVLDQGLLMEYLDTSPWYFPHPLLLERVQPRR